MLIFQLGKYIPHRRTKISILIIAEPLMTHRFFSVCAPLTRRSRQFCKAMEAKEESVA